MGATPKQKRNLAILIGLLILTGISFVYFLYHRNFAGYSLSLAVACGVMLGVRDVCARIDKN